MLGHLQEKLNNMNSDYLHPFISDEDVVNTVKDKIKTKTPFALTRFGDGEIYILNRNASNGFLVKNLNEWGYNFPSEVDNFYNDANKILINALINSDYIGLMNRNCDIVSIGYSESKWSLKKDLIENFGTNPNKLQICNHMISRTKLFGSVDGFRDIIQGNDFHIITSHSESMKRKNLDELFGVNITYTDHPMDINFNNRDEFIDNFKNIKEQIVIMGVGLQKDYGVILRDLHNKISLDMGATMDAWSGIISRPWFNSGNKQSYLVI